MNGIVKLYFINRGYGFIDGDDGETYYFHISDTNLVKGCRYNLDGAAVQFTASNEVVNGIVKKRARDIVFELGALMMDQMAADPEEVSDLLKGKVIIGFMAEDNDSGFYKKYVLDVKDPETGKEAQVSFTGL